MAPSTFVYALNATSRDELFRENAVEPYEHQITFSALVDLMSVVVCPVHRSVNSAYLTSQDKIGASLVALDGKLNRMQLPLSTAFAAEVGQPLGEVVSKLGAELPSPVPGYRVKLVDGKHLAASERRLNVRRGPAATPLPGQALVGSDPNAIS